MGREAERCIRVSTDFTCHALRYYEFIGILQAPRRVSGQRRYDDGIIKQVRFIQLVKKAGFSIEEMKILLGQSNPDAPYAARLHHLARRKLVEVEALIAQAQTMKAILEAGLKCKCLRLEDCLLFMGDED
jgi:MerR family redox-sensitive transcriptional activator SoxR